MHKNFVLLALLTGAGASLWAQPAEGPSDPNAPVTVVVRPLDGAIGSSENTTAPFIVNILTVIGQNTVGLPCYNCVNNVGTPSLGILEPSGVIKRGGAPSQIDAFLFDQNYTGSCTFTIEILDKNKTVLASTSPTISFTAPTTIALGTALAIPGTAAVGTGRVQTKAVCGSSTTVSGSPVYISK